MDDYGKVSIITPMYNSEKYIIETISSVLQQTYKNFEMIIIDDNSNDNSNALVRQIDDARIIMLKNETNCGPAVSRNKGIEFATGRFIAFLDSDDVWMPDKLEKQLSFMVSNNYAFSCHDYYVYNDDFSIEIKNYICPKVVGYKDILKNNTIGCLSAVFDTAVIEKKYMPTNKFTREDMVLWLTILKDYPFCYALNQSLAKYRYRKNSISGNKRKLLKYQYRMYRDNLKFGPFKSYYYLFINIITKIFRKY